MQRRLLLLHAAALIPLWPRAASAHHGWSDFDQTRPLYLEGRAKAVQWRNPHVEFDLEVPADLKLPADLKSRRLPAQTAAVDAARVLDTVRVPARRVPLWHVELAPLTRMEAWKVAEFPAGAAVAVIGYTHPDEKGDPVLRAEYLFVGGQAYGLRSSPA